MLLKLLRKPLLLRKLQLLKKQKLKPKSLLALKREERRVIRISKDQVR
jgi:hypothetical protein